MTSPSQPFPKPEPIRLELVVEYDNVSLRDVVESTDQLIENARGYGLVVRATLFNMPSSTPIV